MSHRSAFRNSRDSLAATRLRIGAFNRARLHGFISPMFLVMALGKATQVNGATEADGVDSLSATSDRRSLSRVELAVAVAGFPLMMSVTVGGSIFDLWISPSAVTG